MELWDLYTKDRERLNRTMVRGGAQPENTYRLVVHICLFNFKGEMLIQQRDKDCSPVAPAKSRNRVAPLPLRANLLDFTKNPWYPETGN